MAKNFVKTLVMATVVVTGISATSARASSDDGLAAFLATTIFLFALGSALEGEVSVDPAPQPPSRPNRGYGNTPRNKRLVPYECLQTFTTQNGQVRTFEKTCMQRNYAQIRRLPRSCERTLWTTVGLRYGYEPQCLRNNGYRARR